MFLYRKYLCTLLASILFISLSSSIVFSEEVGRESLIKAFSPDQEIFSFPSQTVRSGLFQRQWGLSNHGQILLRSQSELIRQRRVGRVGTDINWSEDLAKRVSENAQRDIVVAVIDSGLDVDHPQLEGRIWSDPICEDKDCFGYNFLDRNLDVTDDSGHGTHVSGIITSNWDERGSRGVLPSGIRIMPLKVLNEDVTGFVYNGRLVSDIMAEALSFARQKGADVINMSLGWPEAIQTPRFEAEVQRVLEANIPIIVAAGNNRKNIPTYPCSMEGVICVGAIDNTGEMTDFSNYGAKVDILAPGESIISLFPRSLESRNLRLNGHETRRGTSQAAPFVSAVAAALKLQNPDISLEELKRRLFLSAKTTEETKFHSKYGIVSFTDALLFEESELSSLPFIRPKLKKIDEVTLGQDNKFNLAIPIVNTGDSAQKFDSFLSISQSKPSQSDAVKTLVTKKESFFLGPGETTEVLLEGIFPEDWFKLDSHWELEILFSSPDGQDIFHGKVDIVFSQDLQQRGDLHKTLFDAIEGITPELAEMLSRAALSVQGGQTLARVSLVDDPHSLFEQQVFYLPQPIPNQDITQIHFFHVFGGAEIEYHTIELPYVNRVLSILKTRFLGVKESDVLMVYSLHSRFGAQTLRLSFFDRAGNPYYPNSFARENGIHHWDFPVSTFGGLPVTAGRHEFSWIKHRSDEFGEFFVPVFLKEARLSNIDNTLNLLQRDTSHKQRAFYLAPYKVVENQGRETVLELRAQALDSLSFPSYRNSLQASLRSSLRQLFPELSLYGSDYYFLNMKEQSLDELENSSVSFTLSYGPLYERKVLGLEFNSTEDFSLNKWNQGDLFLDSNSYRPAYGLSSNKSEFSQYLVTLFDRQNLRVSSVDSKTGVTNSFDFRSSSWSDQIFNPLLGHQRNGQYKEFFIESRFYLYSILFDTEKREVSSVQKLPINRDSAFPGVQFAETFMPIRFRAGETRKLKNGIFVNSRLIYGNLLYFMMRLDEGEFVRPVQRSWQIPHGCAPIEQLGQRRIAHYFTMLCRDPDSLQVYWAQFQL